MTDEVHFNTSDADELMETKEIGRERANDIINIKIEFVRTEMQDIKLTSNVSNTIYMWYFKCMHECLSLNQKQQKWIYTKNYK